MIVFLILASINLFNAFCVDITFLFCHYSFFGMYIECHGLIFFFFAFNNIIWSQSTFSYIIVVQSLSLV